MRAKNKNTAPRSIVLKVESGSWKARTYVLTMIAISTKLMFAFRRQYLPRKSYYIARAATPWACKPMTSLLFCIHTKRVTTIWRCSPKRKLSGYPVKQERLNVCRLCAHFKR